MYLKCKRKKKNSSINEKEKRIPQMTKNEEFIKISLALTYLVSGRGVR